MSLVSGAVFIIGLYFLYSAIQRSEVSRISPLFGALVTIFTLIVSSIFLVERLDNIEIFAFLLLLAGGELSIWLRAARRADIFGTTMYRIIWSDRLPGTGYLRYPVSPSFFHTKANLIKYFAGAKDIIVTELQAEPWGPKMAYEMPISERNKSLSIEQFEDNIRYAREVGFREAYLWGVEWWLWERDNGRPEFWEYAKTLFR